MNPIPQPPVINFNGPISITEPTILAQIAPYAGALTALIVLAVTLYITGKRESHKSTLERIDANRREQRQAIFTVLSSANHFRTLLAQLSMTGVGQIFGTERVNRSIENLNELGSQLDAQCKVAKAILAANKPALDAVSELEDCFTRGIGALAKGVIASNMGGTAAQIDRAMEDGRSEALQLKTRIEEVERVVRENMRPTIVDEAIVAGSNWKQPRP